MWIKWNIVLTTLQKKNEPTSNWMEFRHCRWVNRQRVSSTGSLFFIDISLFVTTSDKNLCANKVHVLIVRVQLLTKIVHEAAKAPASAFLYSAVHEHNTQPKMRDDVPVAVMIFPQSHPFDRRWVKKNESLSIMAFIIIISSEISGILWPSARIRTHCIVYIGQ